MQDSIPLERLSLYCLQPSHYPGADRNRLQNQPITRSAAPFQEFSVGSARYNAFALRALSWNTKVPLLVISAWAALCARRPFHLGLYSDDWWTLVEPIHSTTPFSLDRLRWFVGYTTNYGPRPLLGFTAFLASSLSGSSAFGLQLLSALLVLTAALSLRSWLTRLMPSSPMYRNLAADLAVISWMAMPWMLGVTAWPTMAHSLMAQILFTEAARLLLAHEQCTSSLMIRFAALLVGSYLTYEAFYFEVFPLILFYALYQLGPTKNRRDIAALLAIASCAQAIPIAFNRYAARLRGAPTKEFSSQWMILFVSNLRHLPETLETSVGNQALWSTLLIGLASCGVILLLHGLGKVSHRPLCSRILALLGLSFATLLIATFTYAIAGYGFAPFGIDSRTLFSASWSFTIGIFALLFCIIVPGFWMLRAGLLFSVVCLITLLTFAQHLQVDDWATVWKQERAIVAAAPVEDIRRCPRDSAILYVGTFQYRHIVVFGASWEITPAVFSRKPLSENRRPYEGLTSLFPVGGYTWAWDGTTLSMQLPGYWVLKFPAKHLYVWKLGAKTLETAQPGYRWPL